MNFGLLSARRLESGKSSTPRANSSPGETIIKMYYWKLVDGYVTVPGDSVFKVAADGWTLEAVG